MPVVYLPHGGGPWPFVDLGFDRGECDELAAYLRKQLGERPEPWRELDPAEVSVTPIRPNVVRAS